MFIPVLSLAATALTSPPNPQDSFSIVVLPDTQNYSEIASYYPIFRAQTDWIAAHLQPDNIKFVAHVGDIVQNGAEGSSMNLVEWSRAEAAMNVLDGDLLLEPDGLVPYSTAIGNHDYDVVNSTASGGSRYREFFGDARFGARTWYEGASIDGLCHAQTFSAGGGDWLHITLDWKPTDRSLAYAQRQIQMHPGLPVLVTTHEHLSRGANAPWRTGGATPDSSGQNDGQQVFRKLIEPNPEIIALFCGHISNGGWRRDLNAYGAPVYQILSDFQADPNGGNGWLTTIDFDQADGALRLRTTSPTYEPGVTDGPDRSIDPIVNFDVPYDAVGHRNELLDRTLLRFRQGQPSVGGGSLYDGVVDTYVGSGAAGTTTPSGSYGGSLEVRCDGDADEEDGLLAFTELVGRAADQIPPGAIVHRAVLTLTTEGAASSSASGGTLHRMLVPWDEAATWDSLGGGVQLGTDAESAISADARGQVANKGTRSFDVTSSIQSWVDGTPNYGWVMRAAGSDRWSFRSSQWGEVMERPMLTVQFTPTCTAPERFCTAFPNTTGASGILDFVGSSSLAENDVLLVASGLPVGATAIFVAGPERDQRPVGDGNLCVGGPILRLPPVTAADGLSQATLALDLTQEPLAPLLQVGSRWSFQCWHRDASPAGFNFTDAIEVTFCE